MFRKLLVGMSLLTVSHLVSASGWVYGNVTQIDDYNGDGESKFGILIKLDNRDHSQNPSAAICQDRFRVVVGQLGMTEEGRKRILATMTAAMTTGVRVRLFVDETNYYGSNYCTVQTVSISNKMATTGVF